MEVVSVVWDLREPREQKVWMDSMESVLRARLAHPAPPERPALPERPAQLVVWVELERPVPAEQAALKVTLGRRARQVL